MLSLHIYITSTIAICVVQISHCRFSSGGTKSVLHADFVHNMHCVVSGEKRFVMIPPEYAKVIGPEWEGQGYYNLDVEAVNMTAYPKMVDVPWYKAVLSPGDCMYIPFQWIHHVCYVLSKCVFCCQSVCA